MNSLVETTKANPKEKVDKRTQNTKIYEDESGSGYAVVTGYSQHYLDTNKKWQDIDSSLTKDGVDGNYAFQNKANRYKVQFKESAENYFLKVKNNGESLEMGIEGAQKGEIISNGNNITYKNILDKIDLSYSIGEDSIKEDIIVNEIPENKSISYKIKTSKELSVQNQKESGLKITDKDGNLFWYIAVPSVIGRNTGDPVFGNYELKKINNEEYIASTNFEKLLPPEETGQYPFTIDPSIIIPDQAGSANENVTIYEDGGNSTIGKTNPVLQVGGTTYRGDSRSLLKFSVPSLPNIDTAILSLASNEEKSSITRVKAYRPTSNWSLDTINWYDQPGIGNIESSATGSIAWNWWNFNLTNLVKEWSAGGANYGIGLMSNSPTDSRRNLLSSYVVDHYGTPSEHPSAFRPYITVYYNNNISEQSKDSKLLGLQSWSRYVTTPLADGNANVNIANGNLAINFQDLSVDGLGFDTVLSHTYNSKKNVDSSFGFNWTISANKHLEISSDRKKVTYIDETDTKYDFNDVDGNGIYVEGILETSSGYYKSENRRPNGLNWGLKFDGGNSQFIATSNANIKYTFDLNGKIIKEVDRNGNSLNYGYSGELLTTIGNNDSDLKVKLSYDNNHRLKEVVDLNYQDESFHSYGQKITYTYESGDLKTVSRYSGDVIVGTTTYNYQNHQLISVLDAKSQLTQFTVESGKVTAIIDALDKKTSIVYDGMINSQTGTTRVVSPKGNETGADKNLFTTKYYYHATPNFHFGIVYKEDSPPTKTDANPTPTILTTQYDHNDDYAITSVTDSTGAVEASAYDDISGLLVYQFTKQKYLAIKNSYNVGNYETGDWRLLDSYNANGVQTVYNYDQKGNLIKKSVVDGDNINLLHNPGYESASRIDANKDGLADYDTVCGFTPDSKFNFRWEDLADYWCLGGSNLNKRYEVSTDHFDGNQSQVVGYANNTDLKSANFYQTVDEATKTEPGQTYKLKWNYKQNTDKLRVQIAIIHYDDHEPEGFQTIIDDTPSAYSADWIGDSYTFQTPTTNPADGHPYWTTDVFMRIIPTETGVTGKAWFDSVKLQKGTALENPVEKYSSFEYNAKGQVTKERTPESKEIFYSWDDAGNLLSVTDPLRNLTSYEYDKNGNKLSKTEPEGTKTTDQNDFKTNYTFNSQRLITSVIDAKTGLKTVYTYDANGDLETTVTPNNLKTTYINDKAGRPSETINPYGFRSKVQYDANGNPTGITDPNKKNSGASYDSTDRLEKETDTENKETSFTYDKNDNIKVISHETKQIAYNYDTNDRLTSESINGTTASTYAYDKESNITSSSAGGTTVDHNYSLTDEITKVSVAGQLFSYHRNKNNQLTSLDKSNGDTVSYEYNEGAQVKTISHLRNNVTIAKYAYEYDGNGNRTKISTTYGTGPTSVQNYKYDNNNQLLSSDASTYTYDSAGNIQKRQIYEETDSYTYNGNRLTGSTIKYKDGISPAPEVYGYDANGNMTSRSTTGGPSSLLHFNGNAVNTRDNRASEIKGTASYVTGKYGQAIKLYGASYLNYLSASNLNLDTGTAEFWFSPAWASDNQIKTLFEYFVDQDNYIRLNKTAENKLELQYVKDKYNYGALAPLVINWTSGEWYQIAFSWDKDRTVIYLNGARIFNKEFANGGLKTLTSPAEKITIGAMASGTTPSQYANGTFDELIVWPTVKNIIDIQASNKLTTENSYKPLVTYAYDSDDYLTNITKNDGSIINYTYDAQKRLTKRTMTGQADILYEYDGDSLVAEKNSAGVVQTKYIYDAEGGLLYIEQGVNKYYPIYDGLGSITMLRDQAGATVATYQYDEWGKIVKQTGTVKQPLRFASYYWDQDAGLYHLGARWYDPTLMRFISVDPNPGDQDDSLSLNEYMYCRNNPINYTDPDGDYIETALDIASFAYSANEYKKNKTWGNAGWMAFDAVMIALPIGTGSGVVRAGLKIGKGGRAANARLLGRAGEEAVGISSKGKKAIQINGRIRYPDKNTVSRVIEVKNVKRQGLTRQIKDIVDYSKSTNKKFELIVRKGKNTKISKPLKKLINNKIIKLTKRL